MNSKTYKFEAEIKKVPGIDGAYVVFPYDIRQEFGMGRVKVHVLFDGEPYVGSIVNMGVKNEDGSICYIIGILKEIRKKIYKQAGDTVEVIVTFVAKMSEK
jgi:bifunctional DNA-binding transcriptional regulator/antitoxin component of YhaV-PrlF toxin-antitoxin module